jgi:transposase-like protein
MWYFRDLKTRMTVKSQVEHEFPQSYREFVLKFSNDTDCATYLKKVRWPEGFVCSSCGFLGEAWVQTRNRLVCSSCRHQSSITAGTILDRTRTPLTTWFEAAWHVTTAKNGVSAKTLERTLGIRYRVAWTILERFRVAMVRSERSPLSGLVEIDESFIGGRKEGGKRGRGSEKCVVAIAVEVKEPKGFGRVRMRYIPDASGESLMPFVCDTVSKDAIILTDGWNGYNDLKENGYQRKKIVISSSGQPAHVIMPGVHRVASLLKRWIMGTHQGSVSSEHLQSYLEEFTFRFNRRTSDSRGLVFHRLIQQIVATGPVTEAEITHGYNR